MRGLLGLSGRKFGWPLRSTVERSSGSARRALRGIAWLFPEGGPLSVPGAAGSLCFDLDAEVGTGDSVDMGAAVEGPAMGEGRAAGRAMSGYHQAVMAAK